MSTKQWFGNALPKAMKIKDLLQGNFANNNTIRLRGFVTILTKIHYSKLDGNLQSAWAQFCCKMWGDSLV